MSKIYPRVMRRDSLQDHIHSLPNGIQTQGELLKPNTSSNGLGELHRHLYEVDGNIHESEITYNTPGHTHETILGESSGPMPIMAKQTPVKEVEAAPLGEKV